MNEIIALGIKLQVLQMVIAPLLAGVLHYTFQRKGENK